MLKIELDTESKPHILKVSCDCGNDSSGDASEALQTLSFVMKPATPSAHTPPINSDDDVPEESEKYEVAPELSPKFYSYKGYLIIKFPNGKCVIYIHGILRTRCENLADAYDWVSSRMPFHAPS